MGTFNANILPTATGLDLGSSNQRWDGNIQTLDVAGNATVAGNETVSGNLAVTGTTTHTGAVTFSGGIASGAVITSPTITSPTTTGTDAGAETLQNKTLTGASNANSVTLLNQQGPLSAIVGDSTDHTVYTYTVAANQLGAGKGLRVTVAFLHSTGTASVTYKLFLGATTIESISYANLNTAAYDVYTYEIFNNSGVTNAQNILRYSLVNLSTGISTTAAASTSAVDMTSSQVLKWTENVAATDQITPKFWRVELIQ